MSHETFGDWCPYKDTVFCQEREPCVNCAIYYEDMPLPYDGRTIGQIDREEHWAELEVERRMEEKELSNGSNSH